MAIIIEYFSYICYNKYMFNWFKSKIELKNHNTIITSVDNKNGVKVGSEIIVPSGFECLIFSKNKYFSTLSEGKYKIEQKLLPNLFAKQQKRKSKIKKIRLVAHYISSANHTIEIKAKKQKYNIDFCINDKLKFINLMLLYSYKVDNTYASQYLAEIFYELLLHNKFNCKNITDSALGEYGIHINSFTTGKTKSSLFNNSSKPANTNIVTHSDNTTLNNETFEESKSAIEENSSKEESIPQKNIPSIYSCPKCGHATKFKTTYCVRCGETLSNN